MGVYGSNYAYGESPFYKDDSVTDLQLKVNSLLIQQMRNQFGNDSAEVEFFELPEESIPELTVEEKVNSLLIQQLRRQYGTG